MERMMQPKSESLRDARGNCACQQINSAFLSLNVAGLHTYKDKTEI